MNVLEHIAATLGRTDEEPNVLLAQEIADTGDAAAVKDLLALLSHEDTEVQGDSIKVLCEIAALRPSLVEEHCEAFGTLLGSQNNRLVWGAMIALDAIAASSPTRVHALLAAITHAANSGSVITRDHAVGIFIQLAARPEYADECLPILLRELGSCPTNQLPMYAEQALERVIDRVNKEPFEKLLVERRDELQKDSRKERIDQVLKKLAAL
ncbi:MAG TPA: hypothetical protein VNO21_12165 [Polyangiaceae bacterium]|nr:hypothetical protein [Polyangiaceae bacterium]